MRNRPCRVVALALCLLPAMALGASVSDLADGLPDNYLLDLYLQAADKTVHASFVVADEDFEISVGLDPIINFSGTISFADDTFFIVYELGIREEMVSDTPKDNQPPFQYGSRGSIRIREGRRQNLITVGDRSFNLKITRLPQD